MTTELATRREATTMEIIRDIACGEGDPVQKAQLVRELVALQQSQERFQWEREERQARIDFDEALNRCQAKVGTLRPNQGRKSSRAATENSIFWLDYVGLDAALRPLYLHEGFSVSFSEVQDAKDNYVGMRAIVSRGGISREFFKRLTLAPSFEGMPKADAEASAASRVKRYLMLQIFNIAVGIDRDEKEPFEGERTMSPDDLQNALDAIKDAGNLKSFEDAFLAAHKEAGADPHAHLDIDLFSLREAKTPDSLRSVWRMIHAKRSKDGNVEALQRVVAEHEKAKVAFAKGGAL
jgi:hypothetical protein